MLIEAPHDLCSIESGTASNGYDPIGTEVEHGFSAFDNRLNRGIWLDAVDDDRLYAGFLKQGDCLLKESEFLHGAAAGYDGSAISFQEGKFFKGTFSVIDGSGNGKTHDTHSSSPWDILYEHKISIFIYRVKSIQENAQTFV